jgi:uncharacterized membrane protein
MTAAARGRRRPSRTRSPRLVRIVRARPRLFVSGAIAVVVIAGLFVVAPWRVPTRLLVGWDIGIALYLVLAFHVMATSTIDHIRQRAAEEDEGQAAILMLTVAAAMASLAAIFALLSTSARNHRPVASVVLATVTIVLSWAFIHTIFALHYAHEFYDETAGGGLAFPGDEKEPDYWDFVYFSFIIGMTSQVSDVGITSKLIRRTATAHGVIAFFFNAALLALTINLAASAI